MGVVEILLGNRCEFGQMLRLGGDLARMISFKDWYFDPNDFISQELSRPAFVTYPPSPTFEHAFGPFKSHDGLILHFVYFQFASKGFDNLVRNFYYMQGKCSGEYALVVGRTAKAER